MSDLPRLTLFILTILSTPDHFDPCEVLSAPGSWFFGRSGPARAVTTQSVRMTTRQHWDRECLPVRDHQLLGQTPQDYSAQILEPADEAAGRPLITNTIIPPGTGQQLPSDSWMSGQVVKAGGVPAGVGGMGSCRTDFLLDTPDLAGKGPCPACLGPVTPLVTDPGPERGPGFCQGRRERLLERPSQPGWACGP